MVIWWWSFFKCVPSIKILYLSQLSWPNNSLKIIKNSLMYFFPHDWQQTAFYPKAAGWETSQLQQMRCYSIISMQQTPRHPEIQHPHTREHTRRDGWLCQSAEQTAAPILGCALLSHNGVSHTRSSAVSGAYQPPSSQETLPRLPLFYLIMHLHTLTNKPGMLKSAVQTRAKSVRGACWRQGQKIVLTKCAGMMC